MTKDIARGSFVGLIYQQFIAHITSGNQRTGQAWMNALNDVSPELHKELSGTEADCFYDDRKVEAFKAKVFSDDKKEG